MLRVFLAAFVFCFVFLYPAERVDCSISSLNLMFVLFCLAQFLLLLRFCAQLFFDLVVCISSKNLVRCVLIHQSFGHMNIKFTNCRRVSLL